MSLKIAAEHLKSKGRGSDTELIHMTKGEIKGLRQLALAHGGDLTINPETGLPEAGFLSKILPVVAAAAATYFTAGAAAPLLETSLGVSAATSGLLAGAGAGALIGGASSALQGGDFGRGALYGGIGGGISGGLGAYDANAAFDASQQAVLRGGEQATTQLAGQTAADVGRVGYMNAAQSNIDPSILNSMTPQQVQAQAMINPQTMPNLTPDARTALQADVLKAANPTDVVRSAGMGNVVANAPAPSYYSNLGTGTMDMVQKAAILAAPGLGAQMGLNPSNTGQVPTGQSTSTLKTLSPNFRAYEPARPNPYAADVYKYPDYRKNPYTGMAGGGAVAFANRGMVQDLSRSSGADVGTYTDTDPNTNKLDAYNAALYRFNKANKKAGIKDAVQFKQAQALGDIEEAAGGGIMHGLGGYSDGGRMLKGPGDGMSDSIPAVIGSKQPARLADGEFVVPADVVSHLGNGSTDAGAKKLYKMMDKIRSARTGKKKQAPQVNTNKFLPA
jgi:hypothetical protein